IPSGCILLISFALSSLTESKIFEDISVVTIPGEIQLTLILFEANSNARALEAATKPPFDIQYAAFAGCPKLPITELIKTTEPPSEEKFPFFCKILVINNAGIVFT